MFEVSRVEEGAGEAAEQRHEAELNGGDPGDLGGGEVGQLVERVVGLPYAELDLAVRQTLEGRIPSFKMQARGR